MCNEVKSLVSTRYARPGMGSRERVKEIFRALDIPETILATGSNGVLSPVDGEVTATLAYCANEQQSTRIEESTRAFDEWRNVPAPRRGEIVRAFGDVLRHHKTALAALVTVESGKIHTEALGEVQEMIDVCDFAVGLSRQLYGLTMGSERRGHKLVEYWHPAGVVGVVTAFNFPVAVWSWNLAIALVCGNAGDLEAFRENTPYGDRLRCAPAKSLRRAWRCTQTSSPVADRWCRGGATARRGFQGIRRQCHGKHGDGPKGRAHRGEAIRSLHPRTRRQ